MNKTQFFGENRTAIRKRLPHGSFTLLSKALGISTISVEKCFSAGWTAERHEALLDRSMLLIEAAATEQSDYDFVNKYKELFSPQPA